MASLRACVALAPAAGRVRCHARCVAHCEDSRGRRGRWVGCRALRPTDVMRGRMPASLRRDPYCCGAVVCRGAVPCRDAATCPAAMLYPAATRRRAPLRCRTLLRRGDAPRYDAVPCCDAPSPCHLSHPPFSMQVPDLCALNSRSLCLSLKSLLQNPSCDVLSFRELHRERRMRGGFRCQPAAGTHHRNPPLEPTIRTCCRTAANHDGRGEARFFQARPPSGPRKPQADERSAGHRAGRRTRSAGCARPAR